MGVTYLLDTHVFLWLVARPDRVAAETRAELAQPSNRLLVSSVSAMEVVTKHRSGKLPGMGPLIFGWSRCVSAVRAKELAMTTEHALLAGALEWEHRDPFDRQIVAQSLMEDAVLVTADRAVLGFHRRVLRA